MNERIVKYYVGRINEETGEKTLIQFDRFNGLPRATNEMTPNNAFDEAITANRLVVLLNSMDDELNNKFYYYRLNSDNRTNLVIPDDAPEAVLRWFNGEADPVDPDAPEEEPDAPEEEPEDPEQS